MKALFYVKKEKPCLYNVLGKYMTTEYMGKYFMQDGIKDPKLNGKIVAECDYEIEEIFYEMYGDLDWQHEELPTTDTMSIVNLERASCMSREKIEEQINDNGYAIHIKNLNIFDKPKELKDYSKRLFGRITDGDFQVLGSAPKNMMKCCEIKYMVEDYILISITPQEACNILNYKQDVLVRRKVLKEIK